MAYLHLKEPSDSSCKHFSFICFRFFIFSCLTVSILIVSCLSALSAPLLSFSPYFFFLFTTIPPPPPLFYHDTWSSSNQKSWCVPGLSSHYNHVLVSVHK